MMEGYYTGRVSSVDAESGYIRVVYPQFNSNTIYNLPCLAHEYDLPPVGSLVATVIDRNGGGCVLGRIWSASQTPPVSEGYCKKAGGTVITANSDSFKIEFGGGYIEYSGGTLHISAPNVVIDNYDGRCVCT